MTEQIDRAALKQQALLEKISTMTAQYEDRIADLRVEITIAQQQLSEIEAAAQAEAEAEKEPAKKK